jgi:hypothetical protein
MESQIDSSAREKVIKVREVSMERVKDSPLTSQPKGTSSKIVEPIIEPPCDPIE